MIPGQILLMLSKQFHIAFQILKRLFASSSSEFSTFKACLPKLNNAGVGNTAYPSNGPTPVDQNFRFPFLENRRKPDAD